MEKKKTEEIEEMIFTLELEDEGDVECQVLCIFEYDGDNYVALTPTAEDRDELFFFGLEVEEGAFENAEDGDEVEMTLMDIEDDELLDELVQVFQKVMEEDETEFEIAIGGDGAEAVIDGDEEEDEDGSGEDEDGKWDEFITKKLD